LKALHLLVLQIISEAPSARVWTIFGCSQASRTIPDNYNAATIGTGIDSCQETDIEGMEVPHPFFLSGMGH